MADDPASDSEHESVERATEAQDESVSPLPDHDFRDDEDGAFPTIDELIGTFLGEPSLLPVVIVILLAIVIMAPQLKYFKRTESTKLDSRRRYDAR